MPCLIYKFFLVIHKGLIKVNQYLLMSKPAISGITIALLLVGLVVGAGGGYFFAASSLQTQVTSLNAQVTSQSARITQLNSTVKSLQTDNNNYKTQIQILQTANGKLTADLAASAATVQTQEGKISGLEKTFKDLKGTFDTTLGFSGYYMNGFSFEYPQNMTVSIGGLLDNTADADSGQVSGLNSEQGFTLVYFHSVTAPDLGSAIDSAFSGLSSQGPVTEGQRVTSLVQGHAMKYQTGTYTFSGNTFSVVYCYWYCPKTQMGFGFSYVTLSSQATMSGFQHFLNTVRFPSEDLS
jgi:hypothetical protein